MNDKTKKRYVKSEWTFAAVDDFDSFPTMAAYDEVYRSALNIRDNKRDMYNKAINAALENLMSWERAARADGFKVIVGTDIHQGAPHPEFIGGEIRFVQAYGAMVVDDD